MRFICAKSVNVFLVLIATAIMAGCAVKKDFYATGGSRADGTVDMAYDFQQFEKPVVDPGQALQIAKNKCGVWGYSNAEAFGGLTQNCHQRDGWGACVAGQIVIKYQCLGNLDTVSAPSVAPASIFPSGMLTAEQYKERQLQQLHQQNLPYDEYQKRYREIVGQ